MIYLFTALYEEAELLIKKFSLKKNLENSRFQEFYHQESGIRLTITGVSEIAAASAVSSICTQYKPKEGDILLNIGTCANIAGYNGVFVCHKIIEQATGKTFYPDLLYQHGLRETTLITGMLPFNRSEGKSVKMQSYRTEEFTKTEKARSHCKEQSAPNSFSGYVENRGGVLLEDFGKSLYDMEAAAMYQAGAYFFGPHQMIFLKVVSDAGTAKTVSKEKVKHCMETHQDILFDVIEKISTISLLNRREESLVPQGEKLFETLCEDLHCSKVMRDLLGQHIHYWKLVGSDYVSVIQDMYREELLPCKDKREGKDCFEELKKRLF